MKRILVATLLVVAVPPAADASPAGGARAHAAAARFGVAANALDGRSLAAGVRAAAGLRGLDAGTHPPVAQGATLVERATILARALHTAGTAAARAVRADLRDLRVAHQELRVLARMQVSPRSPASIARAQHAWEDYRRRWAHVHDQIDARAIAREALRVAMLVDAALPALARDAAAGNTPKQRQAAGACDVYDAPPLLCIAGTGANTHDTEYVLTLDLGGDDTYVTSAGGANATDPGKGVIDLGGNDVYRSEAVRFAQGSSEIGIGVLVDVAGNDAYEAVRGQGIGFAGAGILADLGGNDRYALASDDEAIGNPYGQGYAVFGALGIALDAGGDDMYTITSRPRATVLDEEGVVTSHADAAGFGLGAFAAAGISFDGGGADVFHVVAESTPVAPTVGDTVRLNSSTLAFGVGIGPFGGAGLHASGSGTTLRTSTTTSMGPSVDLAFTDGFGYGVGDGEGALVDSGGDDVYQARATTVATRTVDGTRCACTEAVTAGSGVPAVLAMGMGSIGGVGVLRDLGGDDRYVAETITQATLQLHDAPHGTPDVIAAAGFSQIIAQGASLIGAGYLEDVGGNDFYAASARADAIARAISEDGADPPTTASAGAHALAQAMGAVGYGELRDTGGRDTYLAEARTGTETEPAGTRLEEAVTAAQGAAVGLIVGDPAPNGVAPLGAAVLTDVDGGAADSFVTLPPTPTCAGARGQAAWADCQGAALGTNT